MDIYLSHGAERLKINCWIDGSHNTITEWKQKDVGNGEHRVWDLRLVISAY